MYPIVVGEGCYRLYCHGLNLSLSYVSSSSTRTNSVGDPLDGRFGDIREGVIPFNAFI